jgi:hypothetical protein
MIESPGYKKSFHHRAASLQDSRLVVSRGFDPLA